MLLYKDQDVWNSVFLQTDYKSELRMSWIVEKMALDVHAHQYVT